MLSRGDRSRRMVLLRVLLDSAARQPHALGPLPGAEALWETLVSAQRQAGVEFDEIFMQPQTGMWMAQTLRRLHGPSRGPTPLWVDIGYALNIALAAIARAGVTIRTLVPHRNGDVMIPTFGMARLGDPGYGITEAIVSGGWLRLRSEQGFCETRLSGTPDADGWWPLRTLQYGMADRDFTVWLDDIDPYREIGESVPPDRLSDAQARRWQDLFEGACAILAEDNLPQLHALAAGFRSVVPLSASPDARMRSASSGDSSGSALISLPPDPLTLAVTLVHEFQHIKLGGVLHLLPLTDDDGAPRLYAPWRDDPRPLSGLLQGVYAFLGVTDFWRRRRRADINSRRRLADFEFALWREHTWQALGRLRTDAGLTDEGRRFASGMAARMSPWWAEEVDPEVAASVKLAVNDHRAGWRIRHLRPDPDYVTVLARALSDDRHASIGPLPEPVVVPDTTGTWSHQRVALARLRIQHPDVFPGTGDTAPAHKAWSQELLPGDVSLIAGDYRGAAAEYERVLTIQPDHPGAWTGLILSLAAHDQAARSLLRYPELLVAVHRELASGPGPTAPDPRLLACKLGAQLHGHRSDVHVGAEALDGG